MLLGEPPTRSDAGRAVELALAEAVVQPEPGARHGRTGAVAVRRGDGAGRAVRVDRRHVRGARRGRRRRHPADLVEQLEGCRGPVVGDVEAVTPYVEHPALHRDEMCDVVLGPRSARPVAEQGEHGREHRSADGGRWVGAQVPAPGAHRQRVADDRPVRREVGARDEPAASGHVGGDDLRERAVVQRAAPFLGEEPDGVLESRDDHPVPGGHPVAVVALQGAPRLRVPAERVVPDERQVVAGRGPEDEAVACRVDGGLDHSGPGERAVAGLRQVERRQRAGYGDRAEADGHGDPAAVAGADLPLVAGAARRAVQARHRDAPVDGDRRRGGSRPDGHERSAGQRHDPRLGDHRDERGGDRGVDRTTPVGPHPGSRLGRGHVGRGHRHPGHRAIVPNAPTAGPLPWAAAPPSRCSAEVRRRRPPRSPRPTGRPACGR